MNAEIETVGVKKLHVVEQIKSALDGRSQRWLSQKTGLKEPNLSGKLNYIGDFRVTELQKIAEALGITITI